MTLKLKSNTIYRLFSKDKYNNSYFWTEKIYYINDDINGEIEEFQFFMNSYINTNVGVEIDDDKFLIWEDLLYQKSVKYDNWIMEKFENNEWILYEIPQDELNFIKEAEKQLQKPKTKNT